MKPIFVAISAIGLLGGIGTASAMPGAVVPTDAAPAAAPVEPVRLVCNYRHCWHVGYYHRYWYRPYGYYRPYWGPRVRLGIGPFGVGIF